MRVPDIAAQLAHGVFGRLLSRNERMVRVPQQGHGGGGRLLEDLEQRRRVGEVAVGLDQHGDALGVGVIAQLAQTTGDVREHHVARHALHVLVAEHAHVGGPQRFGEVDETAGLVELGGALGGILLVQLGRRAEVRYPQPALTQLPLRLLDAAALPRELGREGQVHVLLEPAQLDRGVVVRLGEVENLPPCPCRTAQGREADRKSCVPPLPESLP